MPMSRRAHSRMRATWARFARAYAFAPENAPWAYWRSSRSRRCAYWPPEVTAITRGSSDCRRSGSSPEMSTNGPTTSVASVRSMPSSVSTRSGKIAPALSMTMSSDGSLSRMRSTAARTDRREPMSASTTTNRSSPWIAESSSRSASSLSRLRLTRTRRAPSSASSPAAARPRPDVGPVMRTVRPLSAPGGGGCQPNSRRRTTWPTLVKLPTTVSSSKESIQMRGSIASPLRATVSGRRSP